jgi:hypothetical protein
VQKDKATPSKYFGGVALSFQLEFLKTTASSAGIAKPHFKHGDAQFKAFEVHPTLKAQL